jgi:DNA-3-methyladenine glycosylase II
MAPLAEPWRPMRGAAAHLWWAYYRAIRKRQGVIDEKKKANAVSNNVPVAKGSSTEAKMTAAQLPRSKK